MGSEGQEVEAEGCVAACWGTHGALWARLEKKRKAGKKRRKLQVLQILLSVQPLRHLELLLEIADVATFQSCCNGLEVSSVRL